MIKPEENSREEEKALEDFLWGKKKTTFDNRNQVLLSQLHICTRGDRHVTAEVFEKHSKQQTVFIPHAYCPLYCFIY